jgi:hypothetical protein
MGSQIQEFLSEDIVNCGVNVGQIWYGILEVIVKYLSWKYFISGFCRIENMILFFIEMLFSQGKCSTVLYHTCMSSKAKILLHFSQYPFTCSVS